MNNSNILKYLSEIPDKRRRQGIRYTQSNVLALVLIGTLAGRVGYRAITRFCKDHEAALSKALKLKHGVPSHVSMTAIIENVEFVEFQRAINRWSKSKYRDKKKIKQERNVISLDGKAIKSSVKNGLSKSQNFIAFVNAFCSKKEIVITSLAYENGKGSEQQTLRNLIVELGIKGAVFTADAAHQSKKH